MKKCRLKENFLRIFGDIKILPYPPFLYYQPGDYYRASGADTRRAIEAQTGWLLRQAEAPTARIRENTASDTP